MNGAEGYNAMHMDGFLCMCLFNEYFAHIKIPFINLHQRIKIKRTTKMIAHNVRFLSIVKWQARSV